MWLNQVLIMLVCSVLGGCGLIRWAWLNQVGVGEFGQVGMAESSWVGWYGCGRGWIGYVWLNWVGLAKSDRCGWIRPYSIERI